MHSRESCKKLVDTLHKHLQIYCTSNNNVEIKAFISNFERVRQALSLRNSCILKGVTWHAVLAVCVCAKMSNPQV
jgi:hypothetical protein